MKPLIWGVALLAAVVGCAPIQPSQPTADHPASPQAAQAEDAPLSGVLAVEEKNFPQTPVEMGSGTMNHGHGQMSGGMMDGESETPDRAGTSYTCPMHPEVISQEPGNCLKFGMQLVPQGGPEDE